MSIMRYGSIVLVSLCGLGLHPDARGAAGKKGGRPVTVRVAAYNVEFSKSATPEQIGEMFKPYKLDIIGFNEAPDGDWTERVGKVLGMKHFHVGKISSANHKNKYKTILSRTPLTMTGEHVIKVKRGWNPASAVKAATVIDGVKIAFYSLHICGSNKSECHAARLATEILPKEKTDRIIVVGDFNNKAGDAAMKVIEKAGMKLIWDDCKIDVSKHFTWNALAPTRKAGVIDHILYNKSSGAKATSGGIIELKKPLSDHKPIWAEIVFPRGIKSPKKPPRPATAPK